MGALDVPVDVVDDVGEEGGGVAGGEGVEEVGDVWKGCVGAGFFVVVVVVWEGGEGFDG